MQNDNEIFLDKLLVLWYNENSARYSQKRADK
jgi:hypothetical protein